MNGMPPGGVGGVPMGMGAGGGAGGAAEGGAEAAGKGSKVAKAKESSSNKYKRVAGGKSWEDETLAEWPESESPPGKTTPSKTFFWFPPEAKFVFCYCCLWYSRWSDVRHPKNTAMPSIQVRYPPCIRHLNFPRIIRCVISGHSLYNFLFVRWCGRRRQNNGGYGV